MGVGGGGIWLVFGLILGCFWLGNRCSGSGVLVGILLVFCLIVYIYFVV